MLGTCWYKLLQKTFNVAKRLNTFFGFSNVQCG